MRTVSLGLIVLSFNFGVDKTCCLLGEKIYNKELGKKELHKKKW